MFVTCRGRNKEELWWNFLRHTAWSWEVFVATATWEWKSYQQQGAIVANNIYIHTYSCIHIRIYPHRTISPHISSPLTYTFRRRQSLIYGEVEFDSFYDILRKLGPSQGKLFYDLGSGTGKVRHSCRLAFGWVVHLCISASPPTHIYFLFFYFHQD